MFAVLSFWSDEGLMLKTSIHCFTISYIDLRIKNSSRIYMEDNVACKHGLQKCIMPPSPHPHAHRHKMPCVKTQQDKKSINSFYNKVRQLC